MTMPERIDLTEAPLPAARRAAPKPGGGKGGGGGKGSGWRKLDEIAGRVLPLAAIAAGLLLLYLLWGLWSGVWSHEHLGHAPAAYRHQQMDNVATVFRLLQMHCVPGRPVPADLRREVGGHRLLADGHGVLPLRRPCRG